MISFNRLGNFGRLGNQMFQYAALKGIAHNRGYEFSIPPSAATNEWTDHLLLTGFKLQSLSRDNVRFNECSLHLDEGTFSFNSDLFDNCPDNCDLSGYFQSEKYFEHIKDDIKKDFTFQDVQSDKADNVFKNIRNNQIVSVHVRRGDYVAQQNHHPLCSLEYYSAALDKMPSIPGIVFSDDIDWAMEQPLFDKNRFAFASKENSNLDDLCLMSRCTHHIIANSSFSWWGAWLANSEKVIAPSNWFGPAIKHNTNDLIPSRWELV
jgi:hypothetical protein